MNCGDPGSVDPYSALRRAQQWVRDTTNAEKAGHFQSQLASGSNAQLPTEVIRALHRSVALLDPNSRNHGHPYHWAAFSFTGASEKIVSLD